MKLLFFLLVPFLGIAQSQEKLFIQQLQNDQFISALEASRVSPDSVIESLYDVYLARYGYSRTKRTFLRSSWSYQEEDAVIHLKRLKLLLKHLREFNIINKEVCADLYKKATYIHNIKPSNGNYSVPSGAIVESELEILKYLYEWRLLQKQKAFLPAYILQLDSLDLIVDVKNIDINTINSHDDILKYFKHYLVIKEEDLPDSYEDAYRYAYEKLAKLDSTFIISDYHYSYKAVEQEYYTSESDYISFKYNGQVFEQKYYHNSRSSEYDMNVPKINERFAHPFNLILINSDSPYRIVNLESGNSKEIKLVLINKKQAEFINKNFDRDDYTYFNPYEWRIEAYTSEIFNYIKNTQIDYYLGIYDSLGLYKHYTEYEKDSIFKEVKKSFQKSSEDVFYSSTNNYIFFDWEMYDVETPYVSACKDFAAATMGDFSPTNIEDRFDFDEKFGKFEFEFKGKRYYTKVEITGDWYDPVFLELINNAMKENQLPGKFYALPDGGQSSSHVYLTPKQYQYLIDNKLILFSDAPDADK